MFYHTDKLWLLLNIIKVQWFPVPANDRMTRGTILSVTYFKCQMCKISKLGITPVMLLKRISLCLHVFSLSIFFSISHLTQMGGSNADLRQSQARLTLHCGTLRGPPLPVRSNPYKTKEEATASAARVRSCWSWNWPWWRCWCCFCGVIQLVGLCLSNVIGKNRYPWTKEGSQNGH